MDLGGVGGNLVVEIDGTVSKISEKAGEALKVQKRR